MSIMIIYHAAYNVGRPNPPNSTRDANGCQLSVSDVQCVQQEYMCTMLHAETWKANDTSINTNQTIPVLSSVVQAAPFHVHCMHACVGFRRNYSPKAEVSSMIRPAILHPGRAGKARGLHVFVHSSAAAAAAASCDPSLRRACQPPPLPLAKVLALKVVVEVEGVSEVLAAAAAPQFGSNLCRCLCFARGARCSSSPAELSHHSP